MFAGKRHAAAAGHQVLVACDRALAALEAALQQSLAQIPDANDKGEGEFA